MITASISGRAAFDPRVIQTKSGTPMTTIRLACSDAEGDSTIWIDVVAFNFNAEWLARAAKGDRICAMGDMKMNTWTGKDGEAKEVLQLVADNLIVPTSKPKKAKTAA